MIILKNTLGVAIMKIITIMHYYCVISRSININLYA